MGKREIMICGWYEATNVCVEGRRDGPYRKPHDDDHLVLPPLVNLCVHMHPRARTAWLIISTPVLCAPSMLPPPPVKLLRIERVVVPRHPALRARTTSECIVRRGDSLESGVT